MFDDQTRKFCLVEAPSARNNPIQLIVGCIVGVFIVAMVAGLLSYARKDKERFKKMLVSLLLNEVVVIVNLALEVTDFSGDAYTFYTVIVANHDGVELPPAMIVSWIVFFISSCMATMMCLYLKARIMVTLRKIRQSDFCMESAVLDEYAEKQQHRFNEVKNAIKAVYSDACAGILEVTNPYTHTYTRACARAHQAGPPKKLPL